MSEKKKIPFTLKHSLTYRGESYGPHENKPTPVGLVISIKMMEGMNKKKATEFVDNLVKSADEPVHGSFEAIPHFKDLQNAGLTNFEDVANHEDLTKVTGIGGVGKKKIQEYLDEHYVPEPEGEEEPDKDQATDDTSEEPPEEDSENE